MLTAGHRQLLDEIERLLAEQAPYAVARVVEAPPIAGAALLGLDRMEAPAEARDRLRASFPVVATSRPGPG